MAWDTDRQQYIDGLRKLADLLTEHDDLPTPTHGGVQWLIFDKAPDTQAPTAAVIVRRLGGAEKATSSDLFRYAARLGGANGLEAEVVVDRAAVCERVVTGTREVTKTVLDPTAPMVEITETIEDVEWRCHPLLAAADPNGPEVQA